MRPHAISFSGKGRTKQSHRDECDINTIMKRFEKTGMIEHTNTYQGNYGDFTEVPEDYQAAVELVRAADEMFLTLPAKVRLNFGNDPGNFLAFVQNPANIARMREMGLMKPEPPDPNATPPAVHPDVPPLAADRDPPPRAPQPAEPPQ